VNVKFLGAFVLALWCLVTVGYARAGHGPRIVRVWLLGMTIWAVVAYIDWKYVDILGFVTAKTPTRFGGMMYDPNNAGAAYAVAAVVAWKYGHRVFSSRATHVSVVVICAFALSQTFSRTGEIGLVAAIAIVLAVEAVGAARWARYVAVGAIMLAAAIGTGIVSDSSNEWTRRPDNISSRDELTTVGLDAFADSGGLGVGLGTYRADTEKIVHNTAVWLLVEMSLVGVLFFFAMCAVPFQAALRMRRSDMDLALALIGAQAVMVVTSNGIEALYQRQWWLVIGLCASASIPRGAERVR
jgi:O-antigen ligase